MISQTTEYALRAVVWLAGHREDPLTTQQIAAGTRVPAGYLSKVLQALGKAGLVHSQRGLHGGFMLARPPERLSVLDVVNAVDPVPRIRRCPLGLRGHGTHLCPLHQRLDDAAGLVERSFKESMVSELLDEPERPAPLCACSKPGAGGQTRAG
jgi:Rrf2 family nitric oxide-sensitive transcriptional repressor